MSTTKKYWKGLDELSNSPEFISSAQNEFAENIPVEKFLGESALEDSSTSRRDFLKFLGFSVTAATLASCETPVTKAIPYVVKPEEVTPGVANWYASSYYDGNDYCSILVKTREGRPIKIEGNSLSMITKGGTNARVQASVLSLYDNARITGPYAKKQPTTWSQADREIGSKLNEIVAKGGSIRILSSTIISPSTKRAMAEFMAKYPNTKHVTVDAVSYYGIQKANKDSFGKAVIPTYNFDKANVIVSLGADFLVNWLSPIEAAKQYVKNRKVGKERKEMSKHIQFESVMTVTGSNADDRYLVKPSQLGTVAVALYNAIGGGSLPVGSLGTLDKAIANTARALMAAKGKALVVCGSNDPSVQMVVNAINEKLGSYGEIIDLNNPSNLHQGNDEEFVALVNEMKDGKVNALFTYNVNPVYTSAAGLGFADAYKKVDLKVSLADRLDETASWADYVCPDNHYLESWNDHNPRAGHYSFCQPAISPLFAQPRYEGTRQAQESFLKWSGNNTDFHSYMQKALEGMGVHGTGMFSSFWNQSLHDGVATSGSSMAAEVKEGSAAATFEPVAVASTASPAMDLSGAAKNISNAKTGQWELCLYEKTSLGNGNQANNPWLQELPDPISKVTWDNYITMSPIDMEKAGYSQLKRGDNEGNMVNLTVSGVTVKVPVYPAPGQTPGTIGLALGYGRTHAGRLSHQDSGVIGVNAYPFIRWENNAFQYDTADVKLADIADMHPFASTQTHNTMMGRAIVKETTLDKYIKDPSSANPPMMLHFEGEETAVAKLNLWDNFSKPDHRWGMSIDLNSCIGCGACVVSCNAENNVPVVGKEEVMRSREMHWIRIDRYFTSDMTEEKAEKEGKGSITMFLEMEAASANPKVVFQPVMCQHCNHAPCETVCPVLATSHSNDGLNQMIYNRCIGTRYCANNCPYKVRRFNWFNYSGNTDFANVNPAQDDLARMVLNPDVVVRSRGVMEKCTLCVQRIQEGKLNAKKELRKVKDGEIQTACAQACPTNAIIFGDLNDKTSEISKLREDERNYFLLEEVGIQPSVAYLTKVRNSEEQTA
jgi:MoCo/4Fe-4S cofactor protein with predicted Tat translocation signal